RAPSRKSTVAVQRCSRRGHYRDTLPPLRFFFVLAGTIWGIPVAARAQAPPDVVLMVPAEVRAGWTAALQVELAPRGASVIPVDPPEGATVLLRDAAAQQEAIDRGAAAAAWVEPTEQ